VTKILLLEDDLLFAETLQDLLDDEGFEVTLCHNGEEALSKTYEQRFDLYLLDINVPLLDGLSLLRELRGADDMTPAIYITSYDDKGTLGTAFENGADDYLKKPFDTDELVLRINALLRRVKGKSKIVAGDLELDSEHKCVRRDGELLELSLKEYQLLGLLIRNVGEIVPKEMIVDELWSSSEGVSDGAIRVYINRLKTALGGERIENIRGVGYRLVS